MRTQLAAALLSVLLAAPCAAGKYSAAEIKRMFLQSVDTEDVRLRMQLRSKIAEDSPESAYGIASRTALLVMSDSLTPSEIIARYSAALALDPTIAVAYYNRAHAYLDLKQNEKALEGYQKAIDLGFNKAMAYQSLANAQQALGQDDAAFENFSKSLAMDPDQPFAYNNRATLYTRRGEYDKAIADLNAALKLSQFAMAYMNRAEAYGGKKQYQQAMADYRTAERMIPDAPDVYVRRSRMYLKMKEYQKAIADAETALRIAPGNAIAMNSLAAGAFYSGDYDRAETAYKRYATYYPKDAAPYEALSSIYLNKKQNAQAIDAMKKAVALAPQRADLRERLAKLQARYGDIKEAETGMTAIISTGTKDTRLYYIRAGTRLEALDYKGAEADLKLVLKKTPNAPDAMVYLSLAYLRTGRRSEGLELFSSVMDTDAKRQKEARDSIAEANPVSGKNTRAMLREMFKLYDAGGGAPAETAQAAQPATASELTQDDCYCVVYTGQMPPYFLAKVTPPPPGCEKVKFKPNPQLPGISGLKNCNEFKKEE